MNRGAEKGSRECEKGMKTYNSAPAARIGGAEAGKTVLQSPTVKKVVVGKVDYCEGWGRIRYQRHDLIVLFVHNMVQESTTNVGTLYKQNESPAN